MGFEDAERLQHEIDECIARTPEATGLKLVLDHGSDVTDLTACVAVRAAREEKEYRLFSIVTAVWMVVILHRHEAEMGEVEREHFPGFYCTGGPLIIAKEITAEVIVRGVLRYLFMESGSR